MADPVYHRPLKTILQAGDWVVGGRKKRGALFGAGVKWMLGFASLYPTYAIAGMNIGIV
jgi:hypothetical protein